MAKVKYGMMTGMEETKRPVTWLGSQECDMCGCDVTRHHTFYDAKTYMGPWAVLCEACYPKYGIGLGTGRGQKYDSETMVKLEG